MICVINCNFIAEYTKPFVSDYKAILQKDSAIKQVKKKQGFFIKYIFKTQPQTYGT